MTGKGKLGRFIKLIAPGMVEDMALAALKDDVKAALSRREAAEVAAGHAETGLRALP
jgi:hypothetical protein